MHIELVYEKTCPNIEAARSQLLRAFTKAGITPRWQEWEVSTPEAATTLRAMITVVAYIHMEKITRAYPR